jgi:acyl carrier protein
MDYREIIIDKIIELLAEDDKEIPELTEEMILLDSGLDSLGFAILVTVLDEQLGFDPFTESEDPIYPTTLKEFISVYESFGE